MQSRKIHINGRTNIVKLAALLGFGSYLSTLLEVETVASVLFACSLLSVAANYFFFVAARRRVRLEDIAFALAAILSMVLSEWELNFDYFKPAIIVFCTVLCIGLCTETEIDASVSRMVARIIILVALITIVQYYFGGLRGSYYGNTGSVTLNFSNPNETAMWLLFLIVLLWDAFFAQKSIAMRLLTLVCAVLLLPVLYRTQSRNCLFAIIFYLAGKFFLGLLKIKKLPAWFVLLITLVPVLVYVGYMYVFMPNYDRLSVWFRFLISEGKPLTSRYNIWSDLEMEQWKHILFGNYAVYRGENLHNSMATLYCGYGAFYTFLVYRKLYRVLKRMPNAGMQLALGTVWLTGCFEASIFVGIAGMYMLVLLLPVFHQPELYPHKAGKI